MGVIATSKYILEMLKIRKRYEVNDVLALNDAEIRVKQGTIHALVGENGAGKTTLMKILCGIEKKDAGEIWLNGDKVDIRNPRHSFSLGIGMVHQHFRLIDDFTVAENVVLGVEITRKFGFISLRDVILAVKRLSKDSGLMIEPSLKVRELSMGQRQKVEILKLLYRGADIIVLDEPTSVLTEQEITDLFNAVRRLKAQGKTIIFISHKLKEVREISNEITVLRKGKTVQTGKTEELNEKEIAYAMVGEEIPLEIKTSKGLSMPKRAILHVRDLHVKDRRGLVEEVRGISFDVKAGEILGIAGVAGNGQKELVEALFGIRKASSGSVFIDGKDVTSSSIRVHRENGMAYIPDDRIGEGSCPTSSIVENIIADRYYKPVLSNRSWIDISAARRMAGTLVKEYDVRTSSIYSTIGMLSGGNIQKIIIAREFSSNPKVLIICEPTWGLDIRSTKFVYDRLMEMKINRKAILLISSNLDEILDLSDRILVIYEGEIVADFNNTAVLTKAVIGEYMMGLHLKTLRREKSTTL